MKLFISKNEFKKEDKHPDIKVSFIQASGSFTKVGAGWKAKSGKGYNCVIEDEKLKQALKDDLPPVTSEGVDGEVIDLSAIPF